MYETFYQFREKPFQIVPNPAFLYKSPKHETALSYLEYGVAENVGFILLTGEIGSGKTMLVHYILSRLNASIDAAVIFNTNVSSEELLGMILEEFDVPRATNDKASLLSALNQFLIDRYAQRKRVLLIIDEGQNLSEKALEEVRMLSNLQSDDQSLLQIMLVGQPELVAKLKKPSMRQFTQRIAASYHLTGLNREETGEYISHRLVTAGGRPDLFTAAAVDLIHQLSGGIPRSINLLCQAALVYGFAEESQMISQDIVRQILEDNLGVGYPGAGPSPSAGVPDRGGEPAADASHNNGFQERIESIEQMVNDIQRTVDIRLRAIELDAGTQRRETTQNLLQMLQQERKRSEQMLRKYTVLEMEFLNMQRLISRDKKGQPTQTEGFKSTAPK
jgi:putative secretion ATPase (PEP-CTERM system associated)